MPIFIIIKKLKNIIFVNLHDMKKISAGGGGSKSHILKACHGGNDIEDLISKTCCLDLESGVKPRGYTAEPKKFDGQYVLVNLQNESFAGKSIIVIGDICNDRVPVRTEDEIEIKVRPRNLARPKSYAALHSKTGEEAKRYLEQVASESGRISAEDVKKINTSSPCGCGSCAGACWVQPGMYTPRQILDMIERGVLELNNIVLDFYSAPDRPGPSVGILRPRKVEEPGLSLSAFTPIPGIPCIHLGPKGCVLPRDEMPTNCKALHCDESKHVSVDKHSSAFKLWDNPEGRQAVAWFQRQILARDPSAPTTEEYYIRQTVLAAMNPHLAFAHELGCAQTTVMIKMAMDRLKEMILSPDPEIIGIIKRQLETRLKYADEMEKALLSLLQKSLTTLEVFMTRK